MLGFFKHALVAAPALLCTTGAALGVTISYSSDVPTTDADDIGSFVGASTFEDNVSADQNYSYLAHDNEPIGQTFTTGSGDGYLLNSITLQHVGFPTTYFNTETAGATINLRVSTVLGTVLTPFATETYVNSTGVPGAFGVGFPGAGTSDFVTFSFDTPVALAADTLYGIDLAVTSGVDLPYFFETNGTNSDAYAGGVAYSTGEAAGVAGLTLTPGVGDHVFILDLTAVETPVPEPTTATVVAALGLGLLRRRRGA